ncbi:hypothetical protein CYLTODRAFT_486098 [Cylindrobasidium torrendii FP15055 ss-10]|uniref:Uncharacterized protein n=1 Tax=Cylindrobasidium torrendii FP15055 ss-10 TaxID=1314674 RepID=A0A0D7BRS2_9AGAR|nr:hypothetical protein CYLTODRAFT_486098 [Cylindrobasidium torrendii FP15055 ss-10]
MSDSPALSAALPAIPTPSAFSLTASAIRATLKRSFTDLDLHPAEDSFNPRPYAPARTSSESASRLRVSHRAGRPVAPPTTSQDVSEEDPDVIIIHPPFVTFPNAHQAPDGLTYGVLAANPDWFLDSKDFILLDNLNPNPNAIAYPAFLEPPRGWCPTKKRDAKTVKAGEACPEGDELKLRCTFCRRGYSGVNAKSMWRRHVFEKHKVAMSNRRDGGAEIRPRGRGATKENRKPASRAQEGRPAFAEIATQSTLTNAPITFEAKSTGRKRKADKSPEPEHLSGLESEEGELDAEPEPVPILSSSCDVSFSSDASTPPPSTPLRGEVDSVAITTTESPYDPTATPAFIHSSPKAPSAWRFPSPAFPLVSLQRQLSLGALTRPSPLGKASPLFTSPLRRGRYQATPLKSMMTSSSPVAFSPSPLSRLSSREQLDDFDHGDIPANWSLFRSPAFALPIDEPSAKEDSPVIRSQPLPEESPVSLLEPFHLNAMHSTPDTSSQSDINLITSHLLSPIAASRKRIRATDDDDAGMDDWVPSSPTAHKRRKVA